MKFGRSGPTIAPETINFVKDRRMKAVHARPGTRTLSGRLGRGPGKASNIHNKLNGIALANANPIRPQMTVVPKLLVESASEINPTQPAIVHIEKAKRRFTGAWESRRRTKTPRPRRTMQRIKMLTA